MNRGDRTQTVPVLDSVVVERDVLNVEDTEPGKLSDPRQAVPVPDRVVVERDVRYVEDKEAVKRGEPRQTVPVPEKVVMESYVLNVEETEPVKGKDPSQNVPAPDSVVIQREVPDLIHKAVELYEKLMAGDIGIAEIYSDSLLDTAKDPSHSTSLAAIYGHGGSFPSIYRSRTYGELGTAPAVSQRHASFLW